MPRRRLSNGCGGVGGRGWDGEGGATMPVGNLFLLCPFAYIYVCAMILVESRAYSYIGEDVEQLPCTSE